MMRTAVLRLCKGGRGKMDHNLFGGRGLLLERMVYSVRDVLAGDKTALETVGLLATWNEMQPCTMHVGVSGGLTMLEHPEHVAELSRIYTSERNRKMADSLQRSMKKLKSPPIKAHRVEKADLGKNLSQGPCHLAILGNEMASGSRTYSIEVDFLRSCII